MTSLFFRQIEIKVVGQRIFVIFFLGIFIFCLFFSLLVFLNIMCRLKMSRAVFSF